MWRLELLVRIVIEKPKKTERKAKHRGITSSTLVSASSFRPADVRSKACSTIFTHSKT